MSTVAAGRTDRRHVWALAGGVASAVGALLTPLAVVLALITIIASVVLLRKGTGHARFLWAAIALSAATILVMTAAGIAVGMTTTGTA